MSDAVSINKDKSRIDLLECQAGTNNFMAGPWGGKRPPRLWLGQFMTC